NRRRYGWYLLALPVLIGAVSLSVARAHGPGGGGPGGPGEFMQWRVQRMLDSVGASDAQKQQIKAIFDAAKPQEQSIHQQHAALRKQIEAALTAPTIDSAAIEKLRQQSVQLMDKGSAVFTPSMVAAAKVLTPDQRKQIAEKIQERREHHGGFRGGF